MSTLMLKCSQLQIKTHQARKSTRELLQLSGIERGKLCVFQAAERTWRWRQNIIQSEMWLLLWGQKHLDLYFFLNFKYLKACSFAGKNDHSDVKRHQILVHVFLSAIVCYQPLMQEQTCLANAVWQDQGQIKFAVLENKAEQNQGNLFWAVIWYYGTLIWTTSA